MAEPHRLLRPGRLDTLRQARVFGRVIIGHAAEQQVRPLEQLDRLGIEAFALQKLSMAAMGFDFTGDAASVFEKRRSLTNVADSGAPISLSVFEMGPPNEEAPGFIVQSGLAQH